MNDESLLHGQIEYYRQRAAEYDDWFYQRGRYDEGQPRRREWRAENARADAVLRSLGPVDAALELAAGTGIWSERLLPRGTVDHENGAGGSARWPPFRTGSATLPGPREERA